MDQTKIWLSLHQSIPSSSPSKSLLCYSIYSLSTLLKCFSVLRDSLSDTPLWSSGSRIELWSVLMYVCNFLYSYAPLHENQHSLEKLTKKTTSSCWSNPAKWKLTFPIAPAISLVKECGGRTVSRVHNRKCRSNDFNFLYHACIALI